MTEKLKLKDRIWIGIKFGLLNVFFVFTTIYLPLIIFSTHGHHIAHRQIPLALIFIRLGIMVVLVLPLIELISRYAPIRITQHFTKNKTILWTVIILIAALNSFSHSAHQSIMLFVGNIIYALAFLGGGYFASLTAHAVTVIITTIISVLIHHIGLF